MTSKKPIILLDVHMEGMRDILLDKGWNVETVTKQIGPTKEDRDDTNVIDYARKNGCVVVTEDGKQIPRLRAAGIEIITIELDDKAQIIHEKLKKKYGSQMPSHVSD